MIVWRFKRSDVSCFVTYDRQLRVCNVEKDKNAMAFIVGRSKQSFRIETAL